MRLLFQKLKNGLIEDFKTPNSDFFSIALKSTVLFFCIAISIALPFFVYITLALAVIFVLMTRGMRKIYILIFLIPFYNVFRIDIGQLYLSAYIMLLIVAIIGARFIYELFTKKRKLDIVLTILVGVFCLYIFLPFSPFNLIKILTVFSCVSICYLYYVYREECDFKEMVLLLAYAFILAGILSAFRGISYRLEYFLPDVTSYVYDKMRFSGLSRDPNYFGLEIILTLSCLSVLYYKNKINLLFYPLVIIFTVFGILTVSKSFIIVWAVWFVLMIFFLLIKKINSKRKLFTILSLVICCIIPFAICYRHSVFLYSRLFNLPYEYGTGTVIPTELSEPSGQTPDPIPGPTPGVPGEQTENIINMFGFTTGRFDIWKFYFNETTSKLKVFLFGYGIGADYLTIDGANTAVHNSYLQSIYYFGMVGTLIYLSIFVYLFVKTRKKSTFSLINFLPLLTVGIFIWSLDTLLSFRTFLLIILISASINHHVSEKESVPAVKTKKKKLLIVNRNLTIGGIEKSIVNFVKQLGNKFEIDLLLCKKTGAFLNDIDTKSVNVIECENKLRFYGFESNRGGRNSLQKLYYFVLKVIRKLSSWVPFIVSYIVSDQKTYKGYDYAISFSDDPFCMEFVLKKVEAQKKFVICHNDANYIRKIELPICRVRKFDKILGVSSSCSKQLHKVFNKIPKEKFDYVYNFQDVDSCVKKSTEYTVPKNKLFTFLTVARAGKQKSPMRTLVAINRLHKEGFKFNYIFVGGGPLLPQMQDYVNKNKLQEVVKLEGFKSNPYPYFRSANMFFLGSKFEACPMVYAEAMTLGIPVVSTENVSAHEILDGWGIVCENNEEGIYSILKKILTKEINIEIYNEKLKSYKFNNKKIKSKIIKLLEG